MRFELFSLQGLPIFLTFFFWSVGMSAMHLARPLFAASFGVSLFLVALITSLNGVARLVTGPVSGLLMDRWGRRPLLLAGVSLRGFTAIAEFFATSYLQFLVLEFIGGIGVSIWTTGSSVIIADLSEEKNRGRAVASRSVSSKLGTIGGPFIGGILASVFGLRWIFLFNAATKLIVLAILYALVKETRPEAAGTRGVSSALRGHKALSEFLRHAFLIISFVTFSLSLMGQGVFHALFPLYVQRVAGMSTGDVGFVITLASVVVLLVSFPNGVLVDRFGRKKTLVPGLVILAVSASLLGQVTDFSSVVLMIIVFGFGEAMTAGTSQVYVMDLAPENRRGAFLGAWSIFSSLSATVAPLLVGFLADRVDFALTLNAVALLLVAGAVLMGVYGPETRK